MTAHFAIDMEELEPSAVGLLVKAMMVHKKHHPCDMESVDLRIFDDGSGTAKTMDRHGNVDECLSVVFHDEQDLIAQLKDWIKS